MATHWLELLEPFGGAPTVVVALLVFVGHLWARGQVERLKGDVARKLHAETLSIDRRFSILSRMWDAVAQFEKVALSLRPSIELLRADESEAERRVRKLKEFHARREHLVDTFEKGRPFYPPAVYSSLAPVMESADEEHWSLLFFGESMHEAGSDPEEAVRKGQENVDRLHAAVSSLCEVIRREVDA